MVTSLVNQNLRLALARSRENKLRGEAATARILKEAGSERRSGNTLALFSLLLRKG